MNPVIYVFLNKGLGMSVGKAAAQAAHAVAMSVTGSQEKLWNDSPHRTIIILEARDEQHLQNIYTYLLQRGIYIEKVVDEGVNEIEPHTITAIATGVLDKDDPKVILTMSTFKKYRDTVRVTLEVDR